MSTQTKTKMIYAVLGSDPDRGLILLDFVLGYTIPEALLVFKQTRPLSPWETTAIQTDWTGVPKDIISGMMYDVKRPYFQGGLFYTEKHFFNPKYKYNEEIPGQPRPEEAIRKLAAKLLYEEWPTPSCSCPIKKLMRYGCKCGGK